MQRVLFFPTLLVLNVLWFPTVSWSQSALEVPPPGHSVQSGVGLIAGWYCNLPADRTMTVRYDGGPRNTVLYGADRRDTLATCGDSDNGFIAQINWNLLGAGLHSVEVFAGLERIGRTQVWVTTLDGEFLTGAQANCFVDNFPQAGQSTTLEWQPNAQNFAVKRVCEPEADSAQFIRNNFSLHMRGTIDCSTPQKLETLLRDTTIRRIVMEFVPGSADDEANLEAGRLIRERGLETVVPAFQFGDAQADNLAEQVAIGLIASGGVDFFLAGTTRTLGDGACVGVHSWQASDGTQGSDLAMDDPQHDFFLDYYTDIDFAQGQDFYFFTLNAAPADGLHFMTLSEFNQFGVATTTLPTSVCLLPDE